VRKERATRKSSLKRSWLLKNREEEKRLFVRTTNKICQGRIESLRGGGVDKKRRRAGRPADEVGSLGSNALGETQVSADLAPRYSTPKTNIEKETHAIRDDCVGKRDLLGKGGGNSSGGAKRNGRGEEKDKLGPSCQDQPKKG